MRPQTRSSGPTGSRPWSTTRTATPAADAADRFKEINRAYEVLSDTDKRGAYDRFGHAGVDGAAGPAGFDGFSTFEGFGDIFDAFFSGAGRGGRRRGPARGADLRARITLTFEEAAFGTEQGPGVHPAGALRRLQRLRGSPRERTRGVLGVQGCGGDPARPAERVRAVRERLHLRALPGRGAHHCEPLRELPRTRRRTAGAPDQRQDSRGRRRRPADPADGRGRSGGPRSGQPGNLYVLLDVQPHEVFERVDDHILYDLPLNMAQAALGTNLRIPTLEDEMDFEVPAGTQSGDEFVVRGQGVPRLNSSRRGRHDRARHGRGAGVADGGAARSAPTARGDDGNALAAEPAQELPRAAARRRGRLAPQRACSDVRALVRDHRADATPALVEAVARRSCGKRPRAGSQWRSRSTCWGRRKASPLREGEPVALRVYLPASELGAVLTQRLRDALAAFPEVELTARPRYEEDWSVSWREFFGPVVAGRIAIVPSWVEYEAAPGQLIVRLDPGQAFGTGHHETTRLCLAALDGTVHPGACTCSTSAAGSGILSIAAVKLGAARVDAFEIDPIAADVARANCEANDASERVTVHGGFPAEDVRPADLAVVNVSARADIELAGALARALKPSGRLIASGFLTSDRDNVLAAFAEHGLKPAGEREEHEWALLELAAG